MSKVMSLSEDMAAHRDLLEQLSHQACARLCDTRPKARLGFLVFGLSPPRANSTHHTLRRTSRMHLPQSVE
eukprot:4866788-Amphidinium_carterae.1